MLIYYTNFVCLRHVVHTSLLLGLFIGEAPGYPGHWVGSHDVTRVDLGEAFVHS